jgi:ABC-type multidrug transport system fused ATPase/permease subunit
MKVLMLLLYPYIKERKWHLFVLIFFIVLGGIIQTSIPLAIRDVINNLDAGMGELALYYGFAIITLLALADLLTGIYSRWLNIRFNHNIQYRLKQDVFQVLQEQEMEFYSQESIGQIMSRTVEEVTNMREVLGWGLRILVSVITLYVGAFIAMWYTNQTLAYTYILVVPVIFLLLYYLSKKNSHLFYITRYKYGQLNEVMAENYSGIKTVKSFGREDDQIENFKTYNNDFFDASMKELRFRAVLQPGMNFLISLGIVVVILMAGGFMLQGQINNSDFIAFTLLTINIAVPGRFLGELAVAFQMGNAAAIRLNEVLQSEKQLLEPENPVPLDFTHGDLSIESLSFIYPNSTVKAIDNITLNISHGEKVAILGATGAGKSTLINLIPRFYDPTEGLVKINGINIKEYSLKKLRKFIGVVHQDSFLFTLTIRDNIRFGRPDASDEEVIAAAKAAQIHETITRFEQGYDTVVGERGVTLSGGQRQRMSIARAILTNPKIIIFDDSVSAVDPETEARLQATISGGSEKRTILVISQRPSSLKFVDRIVVLEEGKIIQDGKHSELIKQPGVYQDFIDAVETQIKYIESGDTTIMED